MALPVFQRTIVNDNGDVIASPVITVVVESTGAAADLFSDRNGTTPLGTDGVFDGTTKGFVQFYAEPGEYRVIAEDAGTGFSQTWDPENIPLNSDLGGTAGGDVPRNSDRNINSIADLGSVERNDQAWIFVIGYQPDSDVGGGNLVYDANRAKSDHTGVDVFDPDKAFPTDWTNATQVDDWFTADGVGNGVYVRPDVKIITPEMAGALSGAGTDYYKSLEQIMLSEYPVLISYGTFEMSGWLPIPSNKIVKFDGWIKVVNPVAQYEAGLTMSNVLNGFSTSNSVIINPQLDMNNVPASNGIIFRDGTHNVQVIGGTIKNCAHEKGGYGGGRALNIEAGSGALSQPSNIYISGVTIEDSYQAINIGGSDDSPEKNIVIDGIIASNCESLIQLAGNSPGFPHGGDVAGALVSNITGYNIGKSVTYSREHGIINSNRGCNAKISNVKIFNDSTYTGVGSVFMGESANVILDNVDVFGDVSDIVNINTWAEVDALPVFKYGSRKLRFDIRLHGECENTVEYAYSYNPALPETEGDSNPVDNVFVLDLDSSTSTNIVPSTIGTYDSFDLTIRNVDKNGTYHGKAINANLNWNRLQDERVIGGGASVLDDKSDRSGGLNIASFAPSLKLKDLTTSAWIWELYSDSNDLRLAISTDGGSSYSDYYQWDANHFNAVNTNTSDLGESGVTSWRNLYIQNSPTVTSDSRLKFDIKSIDQSLLDFALSVEIKSYKLHEEEEDKIHFGVVIDQEFINNLSNVIDTHKISALCHTVFKDKSGNPVELNKGGIILGDVWQVRYDEWQNIMLEALRRKVA